MIVLWLVACGGDLPDPPPTRPAVEDTGGTADCGTATWATVGQSFLLTYCTSCHNRHLADDRRKGAPLGVDFDSLAALRSHGDRVLDRTIDGTMPPSGGPTEREIARFADWLACGASGPAAELEPGVSDDSLVMGYESATFVGVSDAFPEGLTISTLTSGTAPDGRVGTWSNEYYLVSGDEGWFVGLEVLTEAGAVETALTVEPPLSLGRGGDDSWVETVTVSLVQDGIETVGERTWTVTVGPPGHVDARSTDPDPLQVVMVDDSGELELGWHLSWNTSLPARWSLIGEALSNHQQTTVGYPQSFDGFPMSDGDSWNQKLTLRLEER